MKLPPNILEQLAASIEERKRQARAFRAAHPLPTAITFEAVQFSYMIVHFGEQVEGVDSDWVYTCLGCFMVAVVLANGSEVDESERDLRMLTLGWRPNDSCSFLCPDCAAKRREPQA